MVEGGGRNGFQLNDSILLKEVHVLIVRKSPVSVFAEEKISR